jgi:hypothetical protein
MPCSRLSGSSRATPHPELVVLPFGAVALVEDPRRLEQDHLSVEVDIRNQLVRVHRQVVDRLDRIDVEDKTPAIPAHQLEHRPFDLTFDRGTHLFDRQWGGGEQHLAERSTGSGVFVLVDRSGQVLFTDQPLVEEELTESLRARAPRSEDRAAMEVDLGNLAAGLESQHSGAAAEVDELHDIRQRHILEAPVQAHGDSRPLRPTPSPENP